MDIWSYGYDFLNNSFYSTRTPNAKPTDKLIDYKITYKL